MLYIPERHVSAFFSQLGSALCSKHPALRSIDIRYDAASDFEEDPQGWSCTPLLEALALQPQPAAPERHRQSQPPEGGVTAGPWSSSLRNLMLPRCVPADSEADLMPGSPPLPAPPADAAGEDDGDEQEQQERLRATEALVWRKACAAVTAQRECTWAACALLLSPTSQLAVLDLGHQVEKPDAADVRRVAQALAKNTTVQCFAYGGIRRVLQFFCAQCTHPMLLALSGCWLCAPGSCAQSPGNYSSADRRLMPRVSRRYAHRCRAGTATTTSSSAVWRATGLSASFCCAAGPLAITLISMMTPTPKKTRASMFNGDWAGALGAQRGGGALINCRQAAARRMQQP